eukprot:60186_1
MDRAMATTILVIGWLLIYFTMINVVNSNEFALFVSRNGMDSNQCGNWTNPCGTLNEASYHIKISTLQNAIINVIDGQNETDIASWNTMNDTRLDPCLPLSFPSDKSITITFNSTKITQFNEWFPETICDFANENKTNINEYMFEGGQKLTINNLIVENYKLKYRYGLIKSSNWFNASVQCNNCKFVNISSLNTNPLMLSQSSIQLVNSQFINVYTTGDIIYCTHSLDMDGAIRHFAIQKTSFVNVSANSFLDAAGSDNDQYGTTTLDINKCTFESVHTITSIINDRTLKCNISISNTIFDILDGLIYKSNNHMFPSDICITNTSIRTNQLYKMNENSLLHFGSQDITKISYIDVLYSFDVNKSCYYLPYYDVITAADFCYLIECLNPIVLISNQGKIQMDYINIDMQIYNMLTLNPLNQFVRYSFDVDIYGDKSFIQNEGFANINNIVIKYGSFCEQLK